MRICACGMSLVLAVMVSAAMPAAAQDPAAAAAAVKASPELVGALSKVLGATPDQAAGAAGALFAIAKAKLKADEFSQIAAAVPGMDPLLKAAPPVADAGAMGQGSKAPGGPAGAASAFSALGLKPDLVAKAVPALTKFVSKSGGATVGNLLASALR